LARSFPIQPVAQADLSLQDFGHFFSPQGVFETFVSKNLAGYIDTTKPDWEAMPNASEVSLTPAKVLSLQAAHKVTQVFFAADPAAPRLSYQIEPVALTAAKAVTITIDGQTLKYDGKTPLPATFDWPGTGGASIAFDGDTPATPKTWAGAWAAFRLMKAAAVRSTGSPTTGSGSLTLGSSRFDFRVRALGAANPFVIDLFAKVSCPA
jgi:type VI secretion system protein ImpL